MKEIEGTCLVLSLFVLICYYDNLMLAPAIILMLITVTGVVIIFAIYWSAGWVWKYSVQFKREYSANDWMARKVRDSMCPFGIVIGSFYVLKSYTVLSFLGILVCDLGTLLIAFK